MLVGIIQAFDLFVEELIFRVSSNCLKARYAINQVNRRAETIDLATFQ